MISINILKFLIYLLTIEKSLQHFFTALFFVVRIPGIGTPDIGSNFQVSNETMAIFNLALSLCFLLVIFGMIKQKEWSFVGIILLACTDIIFETIFHGLFFITVSVIVSTILTITSVLYLKINKKNNLSKSS